MKKGLIPLTLLVVTLIFLSACSSTGKKMNPPDEAIESVKSELEMFSNYLPIEGGLGMLITQIDFDEASNTIKYKYQYTIQGVHKPSEEKIAEAKAIAIDLINHQPKEKKLLEQGFTFRYDYYSLDDEFLFSQEISIDDLTN